MVRGVGTATGVAGTVLGPQVVAFMEAAAPAAMKIFTIVGPTSAGKTAYAVEAALKRNGEVISVDSRQIYRGFVIGTGQPTAGEQGGVPHHLLNRLDPAQRITAGQYARLVYDQIAEIVARGREPILCGGSGLYLRAVRLGLVASGESDPVLRQAVLARIEAQGAKQVYAEFARADPEYAQTFQPSNIRRLARAVELLEATGRPPSEMHSWRQAGHSGYDRPPAITIPGVGAVTFQLLGLRRPRQELNARIDSRVDAMLDRGWLDEVRRLLDAGVPPTAHAMQGVGYRQLVQVLAGELALDEAVPLIQQRTRQFARRQLTWFRREPVQWIAPGDASGS